MLPFITNRAGGENARTTVWNDLAMLSLALCDRPVSSGSESASSSQGNWDVRVHLSAAVTAYVTCPTVLALAHTASANRNSGLCQDAITSAAVRSHRRTTRPLFRTPLEVRIPLARHQKATTTPWNPLPFVTNRACHVTGRTYQKPSGNRDRDRDPL